jgi:hypothetical protein
MKKVAKRTSWLAYSSTMKMETKYYSEMPNGFQQITGPNVLEDENLYNYRCDNLKS